MTALERQENPDTAAENEALRARTLVERVCSFLDEYARSQSSACDTQRPSNRSPLLMPQK